MSFFAIPSLIIGGILVVIGIILIVVGAGKNSKYKVAYNAYTERKRIYENTKAKEAEEIMKKASELVG